MKPWSIYNSSSTLSYCTWSARILYFEIIWPDVESHPPPLSSLCVDTGHSADPHRAASTAGFTDPSSPQFLFPPQPSYSVLWSNTSRPSAVPASAARVGCLWKPAYQVKVGSRSRCSHGGNVEAAEAVLSPLHPGLLTASLVRSNSGHGRKRFQVPLHPRFFTLHQGVSLVDTWLLYIPTNCLATPPFFVLFLSLVRVEKSKCSEQIGLQCDRVRTRVVSVKAPFKIQ